MAATLDSVDLVSGEWVNIYQSAGITAGAKIAVQNVGSSDVFLSSALLKPAKDSIATQRVQPNNFPMTNDQGDPGAWAFSPNQGGRINVWVVL